MQIDIDGILANLGIKQLSKMQQDTLAQDAGKDLILLSPTGSGKTLAYVLQMLKSHATPGTCLITVPSRELAIQTHDLLKAARTGLRVACCHGGRPAGDERRTMADNHDIIVGTPGRTADHIASGGIDAAAVTTWVVDEFDKALEMGFKDQIEDIYRQLTGLRRKIFVSATYSDYFRHYIDVGRDAAVVDYRAEGGGQPRISYHIVHSPEIDKAATLVRLLHDLGDKQSMVFLNYRDAVDRLGQILKDNGIHHVRYHGGMEQVDREKSLSRFRSKSAYTMVTTDLAARGLDIDGVDAIIHYHLPMTEEAFVHRNGRSARWQAEGQVFTIINERETLPEWMPGEADEYEIKEGDRPIPQPKFTTIYIGKGKLDRISKGDIMGFLCKQASLGREDVGTITVKEKFSFAAIRTSKVKQAVKNTANEKLKGKKVLIEIASS